MSTKELQTKDARFDTRLPKEQKEYFERAARLGGYRSLTDFVVMAVQQRAQEIITEQEQVLVSKRDSEIFFDAILHPKSPNSDLKKAASDFQTLISK